MADQNPQPQSDSIEVVEVAAPVSQVKEAPKTSADILQNVLNQTPTATTAVVPVPPKGLAPQNDETIRKQVEALIQRTKTSLEDRQFARQLEGLGSNAQHDASAKMGLLKTKVGSLLKDVEGGGKIPQGLVALRKTMDEINPHVLAEKKSAGFVSKLLRKTPVIGDILAEIAMKYETVQTQIDIIVASLRAGSDQLLQDSLELEELYRQVQVAQVLVQKNAYLGELYWQKLEQMAAQASPEERQKLTILVNKTARRVQALRIMEQVDLQFFASIDLTVENNDNLREEVDRTATLTQALLTVGLAIQAALANQKRIAKAVKETQEYTADMLAANAAAVKQQTIEIGEIQNNPMLALDKLKGAYNDLLGAMNEADRIRREGTEKARAAIRTVEGMSANLQPKVEALRSARYMSQLEERS